VTDREVYRYAPTFVVSTIDKIAVVGMQRRFRTLFGRLKKRCPKHGFSGENRCLVANRGYSRYSCCDEDVEDVDPVDPPSILIQDELHLLREEFGAFDSHYETFLQEWANRVGDGWDIKNVTATATIKGAENQVHALYWKDVNTYPSGSAPQTVVLRVRRSPPTRSPHRRFGPSQRIADVRFGRSSS